MSITNCEKCGTPTKVKMKVLYVIGIFMFFPVGLLLLCLPRTGTCAKCGGEVRGVGMKIA